jgi:hypothetical protein
LILFKFDSNYNLNFEMKSAFEKSAGSQKENKWSQDQFR